MIKNCKGCKEPFEAKRSSREYCSKECIQNYSGHTYTSEEREYILTNYGKIPTAQIAEHVGRTAAVVRRSISAWRTAGIEGIPDLNPKKPEGHITIRYERGKPTQFRKTANGWERIKKGREKKEKMPKPVKKGKPIKANNPEKRNMRVLPTRTIDLSKKKPVIIPGNNRTVVYVAMDANPQEVIAKYQEQRKRELMGSRYGI